MYLYYNVLCRQIFNYNFYIIRYTFHGVLIGNLINETIAPFIQMGMAVFLFFIFKSLTLFINFIFKDFVENNFHRF